MGDLHRVLIEPDRMEITGCNIQLSLFFVGAAVFVAVVTFCDDFAKPHIIHGDNSFGFFT